MARVPELIKNFPKFLERLLNRHGEIMLKWFNGNDNEVVEVSDRYAPEHLEIQTKTMLGLKIIYPTMVLCLWVRNNGSIW